MHKNIVELGQSTDDNRANAHCMLYTNVHTDYVTLTAFPLQNGYGNAPVYYVIRTLSVLSNLCTVVSFPISWLLISADIVQNSKMLWNIIHHQPCKAYELRDAPTSLTFNNCTLCPHCICVFCIYLRTNSDLCHLQHKLAGFYNRDEKCLQRGTDWGFK